MSALSRGTRAKSARTPRLATLVGLIAFAAVALAAGPAYAGTISVGWDPITHPDLVGYRVFYSTTSGNFGQWTDVGLVTQTTLTGLTDCTTYYIAVKARSSDGSLSANYSNQVSGWSRPTVTTATPASIARAGQSSVTIAGTNFMAGATVTLSNSAIVVNSVTVSACNQLVASLTVPATATLGAVNVTVANPDHVFGTGTGTLTVANAAPNGVISAPTSSTVTIDEGQTVTFGGTATDPDSSLPLTYRWDFGDGSPIVETAVPFVSHDYGKGSRGTYTANVQAVNALTRSGLASASVTIKRH